MTAGTSRGVGSGDGSAHGVVGATGQQGGAVARALLDRGVPVRAMVRDRHGDAARALTDAGATVAQLDLDEPASAQDAFAGLAAVFAMTSFANPRGTEGEVAHGRVIADAAAAAGVPRLVYSSVGGAERGTAIPHFESKWRVEQYLRQVGVPMRVVRPTRLPADSQRWTS